jgi:BA14K-like protein
MISLKVLSATAVLALALPTVMPTESFAQGHHHGGGGPRGGAPHFNRGGGGHWAGGGFRHGGGGGFIPGAIAGAVIGGAIASQGPYYGGQPYYGGNYYDDEGPVVQVAPGGGEDEVAYCMQTYRSYDPRSGTYMGNDGYRHPCP